MFYEAGLRIEEVFDDDAKVPASASTAQFWNSVENTRPPQRQSPQQPRRTMNAQSHQGRVRIPINVEDTPPQQERAAMGDEEEDSQLERALQQSIEEAERGLRKRERDELEVAYQESLAADRLKENQQAPPHVLQAQEKTSAHQTPTQALPKAQLAAVQETKRDAIMTEQGKYFCGFRFLYFLKLNA